MSFTNDDILVLARAGFTAHQIGALNKVGATLTLPPVTQTQPATQTTATQTDTLSQILNAIQTNAINATQQPATPTTDDILAEIINPPTKEG